MAPMTMRSLRPQATIAIEIADRPLPLHQRIASIRSRIGRRPRVGTPNLPVIGEGNLVPFPVRDRKRAS